MVLSAEGITTTTWRRRVMCRYKPANPNMGWYCTSCWRIISMEFKFCPYCSTFDPNRGVLWDGGREKKV